MWEEATIYLLIFRQSYLLLIGIVLLSANYTMHELFLPSRLIQVKKNMQDSWCPII